MSLLELIDLTKHFKGLVAVDRLSLRIEAGEILGLIGPNGAGKTTIFNLVSGVFPPTYGQILLEGKDVTGIKPHRVAAMGIGRTFQLTTLFQDMTVLENVILGCHLHEKFGIMDALLRLGKGKKSEHKAREKARNVLDMVGLHFSEDELAKNLPHGHQRLLGIAIAIAIDPILLLLDEPMTGMNGEEINNALKIIESIRQEGITILLIEHNMKAIMAICDRIVAVNYGKKLAEGLPIEIQNHPQVMEAYLGREDTSA